MTSNTRKRSTEDQGFDTAFRSDFGDSHRRYPTPAIGNSGRQIKVSSTRAVMLTTRLDRS